MQLVCSNKPRPSVHRTGKGHEHWRRDVHHIASKSVTLCGIDASEWLVMGPCNEDAKDNVDLCKRCRLYLDNMETP